MLRTRLIPCLQLVDQSLVKAVQFKKYDYIGDPINTVRIFNELEVDELCFLDIRATIQGRLPNFKILSEIANECFMPLAYGGGVNSIEMAKKILAIGFEKIVINTAAIEDPNLITRLSEHFGNQSVIVSIDAKKSFLGDHIVFSNDGQKNTKLKAVEWAQDVEDRGAGEILLTGMKQEGTWGGYDIELTRKVADSVSIPVIANGGAGNISHIADVVHQGNASAVALGSTVVYQKQGMGVLVNFPDKDEIANILNK